MRIPGRELLIALVWLLAAGGAFAAFYFLAGPGRRTVREPPPATEAEAGESPRTNARPPPPADPPAGQSPTAGEGPSSAAAALPLRRVEEPHAAAPEKEPRREPKRIFADSFEGEPPAEWERFGGSKTIRLERADGVLHVRGASGSLDWDTSGLRTKAYELEGFSVSVAFKHVSHRETGTKMFFLCAEDVEDDNVRAWIYFHPTRGGRDAPAYAAMVEGGSATELDAPDGGTSFHTMRLACARGRLAAFVDSERVAGYEMEFGKVRFALGYRSPAKGEDVEGVFDSFLLLDWPERPFEP